MSKPSINYENSKLDELIQSNKKASLDFICSKYVTDCPKINVFYCDQCEKIVASSTEPSYQCGICKYCKRA